MEEYLEFAKHVAFYAGELMKKYFDSDKEIEYKEDRTPVTMIDKKINHYLIEQVKLNYPYHDVDGEEEKLKNGNDFVWVCDPIDGTSMYTRGIPVSVFSLALTYNGEPIVGVVQLSRVDFLSHEISFIFRIIHRLKGFAHILFLAVPVNLFLPVQVRRIVNLARFAFGDGIPVGEIVGQQTTGNGVSHPVNELAILVVSDFCFIHEERGDGDRLWLIQVGVGDVLTADTHGETTLRDEHHAVWVGLIKCLVGFSHPNKFSLV